MTGQAFRGAATPPAGSRVTGIMQVVDLEAAPLTWEVAPGVVVRGHGFNGQVPGPTIEATVGDTLAVRFTNGLPESAGIHWHGLLANGGTAQPGDSLDFPIVLTAPGMFCYHIPATTVVGQGLHGLLLVRRPEGPAPEGDRCLIITAVRPGDDGPDDQEVLLLNGTSHPQLAATAGRPERWCLFNLTHHELRLLFGTHPCAAAGSGSQDQSEAEPGDAVLAPWRRLDVVLGPFTAGHTVQLEAMPQVADCQDRRPRSLATLHAIG